MSELQAARIMKHKNCVDRTLYLSWRDKVAYLAYRLHDPGVLPSVKHMFEGSMYIRELSIPADSYFIGRDHTKGHPVALIEGIAIVLTEHSRQRYEAPVSICTVPGYQMVVYTVTDVIARTYHVNSDRCQDISVLESRIFSPASITLDRGRAIAARLPVQPELRGFLE